MKIIGCKVYKSKYCSNSMEWAKDNIAEASDGTLFEAENYGYARGRQGRVWQLYPGQLILTFLLKPACFANLSEVDDFTVFLNSLNMAISVGIAEAVKIYNVDIKWPNDFMIKDKKIGGMLLEAVWQGRKLCGLIVGIAMNVNNEFEKDDEFYKQVTSIKSESKQDINIKILRSNILKSIDTYYQKWMEESFDLIFQKWKKFQICIGRQITIHIKDGAIVTGIAKSVLPNGDLIINLNNNVEQNISFCIVENVVFD